MEEQVNGLDDRSDILFCASPTDSRLAGRVRELSGEMEGDHQDRKSWEHRRNLLGDINTVQIGHLIVQHNKVGWRFHHLVQGLSSRTGLSAYLPAFLLLKNGPQITPYRRIIINHKNTDQPSASRERMAALNEKPFTAARQIPNQKSEITTNVPPAASCVSFLRVAPFKLVMLLMRRNRVKPVELRDTLARFGVTRFPCRFLSA